MDPKDKLIQCADHKLAPYTVICIHPFSRTSKKWNRMPADPGHQDDWLCPKCFRNHNKIKPDDLKVVSIHCARLLKGGD